MRIDLHIHSKYGQGKLGLGDCTQELAHIVKAVRKKNLNGFSIADHNNITANKRIKRLLPKDLLYVKGCEISSEDGHILAYGINEKIKKGLSGLETIEKIKQQGALAIVAHPFNLYGYCKKKELKKFDGLEVFNSSAFGNKKSLAAAQKLNCCMTAGSDAHTPNRVGQAFIVVEDAYCEDDIINLIRKRKNSYFGVQDEPITTELRNNVHVVKNIFKRRTVTNSWPHKQYV